MLMLDFTLFQGDEKMCYLFDCGYPSICNFSRHDGFASMSVSNRIVAPDTRYEDHEEALEQLVTETVTTTTSTTTTTTTTTAAPTIHELGRWRTRKEDFFRPLLINIQNS